MQLSRSRSLQTPRPVIHVDVVSCYTIDAWREVSGECGIMAVQAGDAAPAIPVLVFFNVRQRNFFCSLLPSKKDQQILSKDI